MSQRDDHQGMRTGISQQVSWWVDFDEERNHLRERTSVLCGHRLVGGEWPGGMGTR